MFERILVPLDTSKIAESALPYAVQIASKLGRRLYLVAVSEPVSQETGRFYQAYLDNATEHVRLRLGKKGANERVEVQNRVLNGKADADLLRYADENDVSLIVMARRGRSEEVPWFPWEVSQTKSSVLPSSQYY